MAENTRNLPEILPAAGLAWLARRQRWFKLAAVPALNGGTGIDYVIRIDGTYFGEGKTDAEIQARLDRFQAWLCDAPTEKGN